MVTIVTSLLTLFTETKRGPDHHSNVVTVATRLSILELCLISVVKYYGI